MSRSFQDFEPECHYRKGEIHDIIEFQLKDFRKDELKVHLGSSGILIVSGERPHEGTKGIRFRKEFNLPKDCKANEIRARFSSGILYITIPKKVASQLSRQQQEDSRTPVQQQPSSSNHQDKGKLKQESSLKEVAGTGNLTTTSPNENSTPPKAAGTKSYISRLKMTRKTAVKVVASVTVLSLLFIVLFYVYKFYGPMIIDW